MPKKPEDPKPVPKISRKKQKKMKSEDPRPLDMKTVVDTKRKQINPDPK